MAILPWLTIGASLLSGFLGGNKSTVTENSTQNQNTNSNSTGSQTGVSAQVGETKGTTSQTGTQNQQATTTQDQKQTTRTDSFGNQISEQLAESINKSTGQQVGSVNRLDDATKALLTQQVQDMLATGGSNNDFLSKEVARLSATDPNFDSASYINGIMGAANADVLSGVESDVGRMRDESGVNGSSNSAAKLLESRRVNEARATLGGIMSNAQAEAAKIASGLQESRSAQILGATGAMNNNMQASLSSLLGATQMESTTNNTTQTGSQNTKGNTSETSGTTGNTNTLTSGNTDTKTQTQQTETSEQKQKQSGTTQTDSSEKTNQNSTANSSGTSADKEGGGMAGLLKAFSGMLSADW